MFKLKFVYTFIVNLLILCTLISLIYIYYNLFIFKNDSKITLYFPYGSGISNIASVMQDANVIEDKKVFIVFARLAQLMHKPLISGEYSFKEGTHPYEVLQKLIAGKRVLRKVTIPEGVTVKTAMNIISRAPGLVGESKVSVMECNILPETYSYYYGDKTDSLVLAMKQAFQNMIAGIKLNNNFTNINEVITLASIVEKETKIASERPIVAGVYLNRLKIGMPLQADPTLIYGISNGIGFLDRPLTREDLKINNAYNSYINRGLPPTPIACPGIASILAVVNASQHDYLYFVADSKGGHVFAKTLKEHNNNNLARKALAQQLINNGK